MRPYNSKAMKRAPLEATTTLAFSALIIILLFQPLANAQDSPEDFHKNIPPPLPEDKWKQYPINYTELHEEFSGILTCGFIPYGMFGSFLRISLVLLNAFDFARLGLIIVDHREERDQRIEEEDHELGARQNREAREREDPGFQDCDHDDNNRDHENPEHENPEHENPEHENSSRKKERFGFKLGTLLSGVASIAWSFFFLISAWKSLTACSNEHHFTTLQNSLRLDLASGLCSTIASITFAFSAFPGKHFKLKAHYIAGLFTILAILTQIFQYMTLLFGVTRSVGVTADLFIRERFRVNYWLYQASSLSVVLVLFFICWVLMMFAYFFRRFVFPFTFAVGAVVIPVIFIWFSGAGNLFLGNILGDPLGSYYFEGIWGKGMAIFTALGPVLEFIIIVLGDFL